MLPELWLPCPFPFIFKAPDVSGQQVYIGSSPELATALRELNKRTFGDTADQLAAILRDGTPEAGSAFDDMARFALALFIALSERSAADRLPMKLDY